MKGTVKVGIEDALWAVCPEPALCDAWSLSMPKDMVQGLSGDRLLRAAAWCTICDYVGCLPPVVAVADGDYLGAVGDALPQELMPLLEVLEER